VVKAVTVTAVVVWVVKVVRTVAVTMTVMEGAAAMIVRAVTPLHEQALE